MSHCVVPVYILNHKQISTIYYLAGITLHDGLLLVISLLQNGSYSARLSISGSSQTFKNHCTIDIIEDHTSFIWNLI